MSSIIVYTKPSCVQCQATVRALDKAGRSYRAIDVTQDSQARDYVLSLGYLTAPVVYVSADEHWSGFRPDRLARVA
ncbi:glutaredoxin [Mycobacterium gordonae]|uniref:Glutaredoxin-like protein NrdH n=1 Tax=Mycobacterium gordonae TaxID=1778 RepID=A0A0Q2LVT0_MYCGO|nr:glutaredoxin-like protein NrdH [Mycobacterium gordonae]KQH80017.1 glutaredoxin [Mycobacterium gordonae]